MANDSLRGTSILFVERIQRQYIYIYTVHITVNTSSKRKINNWKSIHVHICNCLIINEYQNQIPDVQPMSMKLNKGDWPMHVKS